MLSSWLLDPGSTKPAIEVIGRLKSSTTTFHSPRSSEAIGRLNTSAQEDLNAPLGTTAAATRSPLHFYTARRSHSHQLASATRISGPT